jgi:ribonuclease P protein component
MFTAMSSASPRFFFPRTRRLTQPSHFARVKKEGEAVRGQFLTLGFLTVEQSTPFHAGIVTSRRVGEATVRNRVRRRLRDIVRREQSLVKNGVWVVVVARPAAVRASYAALRDEWLRLVKRASILAP